MDKSEQIVDVLAGLLRPPAQGEPVSAESPFALAMRSLGVLHAEVTAVELGPEAGMEYDQGMCGVFVYGPKWSAHIVVDVSWVE